MSTIRRTAAPLLTRQICQQCLRSGARSSHFQTIQRPRAPPKVMLAQQRPVAPVPVRWHSAPSQQSKQYDFAQIKQMTEKPSPDRILIDVREPAEYTAGYIPTALNIPVKSSPDAYFLPAEEFEDRFGFAKPPTDTEVVFYCRSGVRSSAAAQLARQQGYERVGEYRGSWLDWEGRGGEASKP